MKTFIFSLAGYYMLQTILCLVTAFAIHPDKFAFLCVAFALLTAFMSGANMASDWHDRHG